MAGAIERIHGSGLARGDGDGGKTAQTKGVHHLDQPGHFHALVAVDDDGGLAVWFLLRLERHDQGIDLNVLTIQLQLTVSAQRQDGLVLRFELLRAAGAREPMQGLRSD